MMASSTHASLNIFFLIIGLWQDHCVQAQFVRLKLVHSERSEIFSIQRSHRSENLTGTDCEERQLVPKFI